MNTTIKIGDDEYSLDVQKAKEVGVLKLTPDMEIEGGDIVRFQGMKEPMFIMKDLKMGMWTLHYLNSSDVIQPLDYQPSTLFKMTQYLKTYGAKKVGNIKETLKGLAL